MTILSFTQKFLGQFSGFFIPLFYNCDRHINLFFIYSVAMNTAFVAELNYS